MSNLNLGENTPRIYLGDIPLADMALPNNLREIYDVGTFAAEHNFTKVGNTWHGASQNLMLTTIPLNFEYGKRYVITGRWLAKENDGIAIQFAYSTPVDNFKRAKVDEISNILILNDLSKGTPIGIDVSHYERGESWFVELKVYELIQI